MPADDSISVFQYASLFYPTCKLKHEPNKTFEPNNCADLGRMCKAAFGDNEEDVSRCVQITSATKNALADYSMKDLIAYCDGTKPPPSSLVGKGGIASFPLPTTNTCVWNKTKKTADHVGADLEGSCRPKTGTEDRKDAGCSSHRSKEDCSPLHCEWMLATTPSTREALTCKPQLDPTRCQFKTVQED